MKKIMIIVLTLVLAFTLAACGGGGGGGGGSSAATETSTFTSDQGISVSLTYPDNEDYRWSEDGDDFRVNTWNAAVIGPDVKIGVIVTRNNMSFPTFGDIKERRLEENEVTDGVFGGSEGFSYYNGGYTSYNVYLPVGVEGLLDYRVELWVSEPENKESLIHDLFESEVVQKILTSVKIEVE